MFTTEDQAVAWFGKYRWGEKSICPYCNSGEKVAPNNQGKYYYHCASCRKRFTVNEFSFRLNERNCSVDTIDRMEILAKGSEASGLLISD